MSLWLPDEFMNDYLMSLLLTNGYYLISYDFLMSLIRLPDKFIITQWDHDYT